MIHKNSFIDLPTTLSHNDEKIAIARQGTWVMVTLVMSVTVMIIQVLYEVTASGVYTSCTVILIFLIHEDQDDRDDHIFCFEDGDEDDDAVVTG